MTGTGTIYIVTADSTIDLGETLALLCDRPLSDIESHLLGSFMDRNDWTVHDTLADAKEAALAREALPDSEGRKAYVHPVSTIEAISFGPAARPATEAKSQAERGKHVNNDSA